MGGFVEAVSRVAYSMEFPTPQEFKQAGASNIVEFNSRRKHVTRFHLEISKLNERRDTPFEKRLRMLLQMIAAALESKARQHPRIKSSSAQRRKHAAAALVRGSSKPSKRQPEVGNIFGEVAQKTIFGDGPGSKKKLGTEADPNTV